MSSNDNRPRARTGEQGNVLFLILIAVILFAALSYAVTRTGSNSGGAVDNEKDKIAAAQLIQYPAGLRAAMIRMVIGGTHADELRFDRPSDFAGLSDLNVQLFHPHGGEATYADAPSNMMASDTAGMWYFNIEVEVQDIGLSDSGSPDGNDVMAFLPGIRKGLCASVNEDLGISGIPRATADLSPAYKKLMNNAYTLPSAETVFGVLGANGTNALNGQAFGCFQNSDGEYVYYHVLAER